MSPKRLCASQHDSGLGEGFQGRVDDQEYEERRSRGEHDPQDGELSVHPVPSLLWVLSPIRGIVLSPEGSSGPSFLG